MCKIWKIDRIFNTNGWFLRTTVEVWTTSNSWVVKLLYSKYHDIHLEEYPIHLPQSYRWTNYSKYKWIFESGIKKKNRCLSRLFLPTHMLCGGGWRVVTSSETRLVVDAKKETSHQHSSTAASVNVSNVGSWNWADASSPTAIGQDISGTWLFWICVWGKCHRKRWIKNPGDSSSVSAIPPNHGWDASSKKRALELD